MGNAAITSLRLVTRGSLLARAQSRLVAEALRRRHPGLRIEEVVYKTSGDAIADRPLHDLGGKGLFTKELEQALLNREIDFAVHSFKDLPVTLPLVEQTNLIIAAVPAREDARDLLVSGAAKRIGDLPAGARVGTGSLRRRCQILACRGDLIVEPVRGNIDTRLRKLHDGQFEAIVLAMAGIRRAGLFDPAIMTPLDDSEMLAAPGQGALALQCRRDDSPTVNLLGPMNDPVTAAAVAAERELVRLLGGDCLSPIAAQATATNGIFRLKAAVGGHAGQLPVLRAAAEGDNAESAVKSVYDDLSRQGVTRLLHGDDPSRAT
jgi:hydroxymethylbilane synthase